LIYAAKPQRGGRSIRANTNNPPQDPPPPSIAEIPERVSWVKRFVRKIKGVFRRK